MAFDLLSTTQNYLVVSTTGGSVLRNQEPLVVSTIQRFLRLIPLSSVPHESAEYEVWLDEHTARMLAAMRSKVRPWGTARKALNLFMRACICDHHLRTAHALERAEPWAEVPLDSIVAKALKRAAGRGCLPQWPGLKRLTPDANASFQAFALKHTAELGLRSRIFLDYVLWLEGRTPPPR
ncbi:MAG: hypothetical protein HBSAPP03_16200 [Phycisphaerae bacterium]|nr:MAG: hypothetical protein HBSAPP03_16200 [Phycisphaerae bacterium]